MWNYEKKLQYPVNIRKKDVKMAKYLITQFGGPDGELSASMRYLTQRYTMPTGKTKGLLTDIGTEELAHVEIIGSMFYQLVKDASPKELESVGLGAHYTQHDHSPFLVDANGVPWTAAYFASTGDHITDLHEDLAAEEKARTTYEHLMNLTDDPDLTDILRFLRQREVVHFQRFGEALMGIQDGVGMKKNYYMKPQKGCDC
ncbi:manganese catalase family protein [Clostridium tyrobutyricum]|jgi:spore coat protein JC|uniref:manganese catalase family protein n=1 Tax=Clostridium tyrobutyricum TaxID=1519 RepID=UPI00057C4E1A|nr:manganese catalase family protein [Clostridium tyrobutyricum]MBV4437914.1 manganese catalase family protein [Clostridium tyrobutyricum]MBV4448453.1 manganese catalase family protein [Clostridium tyrobutyricum]MCH4199057.1 manganese catalase family protein [Clostridium tyrobutyricum]MCH4236793.1 manganese catalase family protein [Clostridium tyrobutyricum]MCH4258550.1 manganese catalase family protein [Clostridium tyrobutyricum]